MLLGQWVRKEGPHARKEHDAPRAQGQSSRQVGVDAGRRVRARRDPPRSQRQARRTFATAGDRDRLVEGAPRRRRSSAAPGSREDEADRSARVRARSEPRGRTQVSRAIAGDDERPRARADVDDVEEGAQPPSARGGGASSEHGRPLRVGAQGVADEGSAQVRGGAQGVADEVAEQQPRTTGAVGAQGSACASNGTSKHNGVT